MHKNEKRIFTCETMLRKKDDLFQKIWNRETNCTKMLKKKTCFCIVSISTEGMVEKR